MSLDTAWRSTNPKALMGIAMMVDVRIGPSPPWLLAGLTDGTTFRTAPPEWDAGIRTMLRAGGFRPTGRNRPAHEFLARVPGGVTSISNVVDVNNVISLTHRVPASVIDASVVEDALVIREGLSGERYVFNRSGQELDLEGLLVVCSASNRPVASPIKDALVAHVTEATRSVVFCAYGSHDLMDPRDMRAIIDGFSEMAARAAAGRLAQWWVFSASGVDSG